jgi:Holliday junction DNA helicase RuvB
VAGITSVSAEGRTKNPLRPQRLDDVVGQARAKRLMERAIATTFDRHEPLDHVLLVGPSGTGKSTFSHVIANEMHVDVYELEAPVGVDTLLELRTTMQHGDILKVEEIHQQGIMERRGKSGATQPEVLYAVMEDRVIPTSEGVLEYPRITVIGTTTDEGMLPDAFINRFPLRPRLVAYNREELRRIVLHNAHTLGLRVTQPAIDVFADASRGVPREINNLVKNAVDFVTVGPRAKCST